MASDWQRSLVALAATVITMAVVALMYWARSVFIPITLAIFLAFVLAPVVNRLQRRGIGRTSAVFVTVGMVCLLAVAVGALITQQVAQLAQTLPDRRDVIKEKVATAKTWLVGDGGSRFGQLVDDVMGVIAPKPANPPSVVVVEPPDSFASQASNYLSPAAEILGQAAFTFVLAVFMLLNREDLRNRMIRLLGAGRITTTTKAIDDASQRISRYLFAQLMVNSAFGALITVGLIALGVKYAMLWGTIALFMRYVPYVGTWIGLLPPTLFSFATAPEWGGGWGQPVATLSLFIGLELICNNVVEPKVYGKSMGLSEVAQLVAAGFWAFLWGPIGLILSGPLSVCLLVLGRHVRQFDFFVVLLGDEPVLAPRVVFYQRLTARDQDEASEIAFEIANKENPERAVEEVLIPALGLAKQDHDDGKLDATDLRYVAHTTREIGEELAEAQEPSGEAADERVRVLLCPTRDEVEQVAVELFAHTLSPNRWEVKIAEDGTLASELIDMVTAFRPAVVVIAVMPPGGISHARYLLTRLRKRFPEVKLVVGRWGSDPAELDPRGEAIKNTDGVDYTLADTRKLLTQLHTLLRKEPAPREPLSPSAG